MVGYLPSEFADPMHKIFVQLVSPLDQISLSLAFTWCRCGDGTSANGFATITGLGLGRCLSFALGLVFLGFELCRDAKNQYNFMELYVIYTLGATLLRGWAVLFNNLWIMRCHPCALHCSRNFRESVASKHEGNIVLTSFACLLAFTLMTPHPRLGSQTHEIQVTFFGCFFNSYVVKEIHECIECA